MRLHQTNQEVSRRNAEPRAAWSRTGVGRMLLAAPILAILAITGCTAPAEVPPASADARPLLIEHGLDGLNARAIIERLDTMPIEDRPTDLMASIRPDAIQLTGDQGSEASVPLPEDEFYVSVAPYVEQTHDCFFHSLTTCVGELQSQDVQVTVTDTASGEVLLDATESTYDNGFLGFWLPRDIQATLTISYDGRTATAPISTGGDDPTCVTTLQLT